MYRVFCGPMALFCKSTYLTQKIREKQVLCRISSVFYSFVPILAIFFVYSHSQSGNRQRKNLKMNAKTNILWPLFPQHYNLIFFIST